MDQLVSREIPDPHYTVLAPRRQAILICGDSGDRTDMGIGARRFRGGPRNIEPARASHFAELVEDILILAQNSWPSADRFKFALTCRPGIPEGRRIFGRRLISACLLSAPKAPPPTGTCDSRRERPLTCPDMTGGEGMLPPQIPSYDGCRSGR
jgi:hypothetical protein